MFFPKLRAQAKWVFVFLALVFGLGFVLFGVGSGSGGLSDLLQGNFNNLFGGSAASGDAGKARDRIKKNPDDAPSPTRRSPRSRSTAPCARATSTR
jgi:hypothetical protein